VTEGTEERLTYERAVELFDEKLRALEEGELSLEAAIQAVDEAGRYLRAAEERLKEAKKRIEVRPPESAPEAPPAADRDPTGAAGDDELPF
jgi:exodeoxyribonuclease VII small subunit